MSTTLTWRYAVGAKTGSGSYQYFFDDVNTMVSSKLADANYKWQVASVSSATNPAYLVLKRKDGSPGRFLLVVWPTAPAGINSAILISAPTVTHLYQSYFPNGNTDVPLNLTAASGTILGNDAGCNKMNCVCLFSTIYTSSITPFYFDSEEAIVIGTNNPAVALTYIMGGGYLFVDNNDNAYYGIIRGGDKDISNFSSSNNNSFLWNETPPYPGMNLAYMAASYGAVDSPYYLAYIPSALWASHAANATDILTDTANNKAAFCPVALIGLRKCEGPILKLRQIGHGPASTGPFAAYSTAGPVVQARQFCNTAAGSLSLPWFVNFKL